VSSEDIDAYLASLPEPKRSTLQLLRERILQVIPEAEQCISYALPAFRVDGVVLAGFAAFKNHLAYLPHSGSVLSKINLEGFTQTKGSLHFAVDECLSQELVAELIEVKRELSR
jgi:uncharacterized protein YdhG (YjbR/CyaY superfamily)